MKENISEKISYLSKYISFSGEKVSNFEKCFRAIAIKNLENCKDFDNTLGKYGINVNGSNLDLSYELYLNCLILMSYSSGDDILLSNDIAMILAKKDSKNAKKVPFEECLNWFVEEVESLVGKEDDIEEANEEDKGKISEDIKDKIRKYYYQFYSGIVLELSKRYTSLFASGYEVVSPFGLLSNSGLIGLSGNRQIVKKKDISVDNIYRMLCQDMDFTEVQSRSNVNIADAIYEAYVSGERRLLYFPNKLLEYAYGRKAPGGDNRESLNTYESHSNSSNWGAYCKTEVVKSLMAVVGGSVVKFICLTANGDDYFNPELVENLKGFLHYLQSCLSLCLLMVDYKTNKNSISEDICAFKLRVCDPESRLMVDGYTDRIIKEAFLGYTGSVPFSYPPRVEPEVFVKEYSHEFNHDSAQASPLFAYKAYLALQDQGVELDWNNMILGMFEDGTILRNGKHGVRLLNRLTHILDAGSRAGKGVMTLNIIASAIYSNKILFYLDDKPDMASMLKHLSPNMFAVNGASWSRNDDFYGEYINQDSWVNPQNIPDYLCHMLECSKTWSDLGNLFYMRALKLAIGIIVARGAGMLHDENFGGESGILLIADEFKNFQESYSLIISKMKVNLPASAEKFVIEKGNLEKVLDKYGEDSKEYKSAKFNFDNSYNCETFYALSYLNSMVSDLEFLSTKRDAGFDPHETELSDIFVIGQHIEHGDMDYAEFRNMLLSGRYKSVGRRGVTGGYKIDFSHDSFGYSMVTFKSCDALFGRNMEDGREVYLAQTNPSSKAYGRLDDKAGNFAYMPTFTDDTRRKIVEGKSRENIELANSCVYFKPFLVLNDAQPGDTFTEQMFSRCQGPNPNEPWVSREEIIRENPNEDGSFVNEAVGFGGYLRLLGIHDYSERLSKGSDVANFVVNNCLGYNGSWLDFITDLRPEALFTIKDIVEGAKGSQNSILDVENRPILREFIEFSPELFGLSLSDDSDYNSDYVEDSVSGFMSSDIESDYQFENPYLDRESNNEKGIESNEFGYQFGNSSSSQDIEDSIFGKDEYYSYDIKDEEPFDLFDEGELNDDVDEILKSSSKESEARELIRRLKDLGVDVEYKTSAEEEFWNTPEFSEGLHNNAMGSLGYHKLSDKDTIDEDLEFDGGVESYEELIKLVTNSIIQKFGGLERINSFKVIDGSIFINGYCYRSKVGNIFAKKLPYDIKREINAGNISKLFDYSALYSMPRLRDLEFDSVSFVYDYVSFAMGYGSEISVDWFFRDIPSLHYLCLGRKLFNRNNYMEQVRDDDIFYKPRVATKFANYSEEILGKVSSSSWQFAKNTMKSKDYGIIVKSLGVTGGVLAAGAGLGGRVVIKGSRKIFNGLKSVGKNLKEMIKDSQ